VTEGGRNYQTWRTPPDLYAKLDAEFGFDCDPVPIEPTQDGMCARWGRSVFLNPPYRDIPRWLRRAVGEWQRGATVVALLPVRTDTAWFHDLVLGTGAEIRWVRGRLSFEGHAGDGRPRFASMIVVWRGTASAEHKGAVPA